MANSNTVNGPQDLWRTMAYTSLFCVGIALMLWAMQPQQGFFSKLAVSLCIGWSINLSFHLLGPRLQTLFPGWLIPLPLVAVGLTTGLLLAGSLLLQNPLFFFNSNHDALITGAFLGITGFVLVAGRMRLTEAQHELAAAAAQREAGEKLLLQTELKLLQAQIEPHFLFNTLSNVIGLVRSDPETAEKTLLNLSQLLRNSLQQTRQSSISLQQEFNILRAYLEIQQVRMGSRLKFELLPQDLDKDTQLATRNLPPLLLQPLVENAVLHGIDPLPEGGHIVVRAWLEQGQLHLRVSDTGAGMAFSGCGEGTGIRNVRERLAAHFGPEASLVVAENKPSGVQIDLLMPGDAP